MSRQYINEVEKAYDDHFTMVYHRDQDYLIAHCKPTTIVVWLVLLKRSNRKSQSCWPSLNTIADDSGISKTTVLNAIYELKNHGIITVEQRLDDSGDYTSNLYLLHRCGTESDVGSTDIEPPGRTEYAPRVVQNLNTNHMKSEPDEEGEPYISMETEFDMFWAHYPRKEGKSDAFKAWSKLNPLQGLVDTILTSLEQQKANNWRDREKKYIPLPATWLRGERWHDEITVPNGKAQSDSWADELIRRGEEAKRRKAEAVIDVKGQET